MVVRPVTPRDADDLWRIFQAVVVTRDTYAFAPDTPRDEGVGYWLGPEITCFVAEDEGRIVGMYKLIPNRRDLGSHVANASFMVHPEASGRGIGRALGEHCLHEARVQGYEAMQFNFVVSSNLRGVRLWQTLGFEIVGTVPRAFRHGTLGLVDAYVMYRSLDDIVPTFGSANDLAVVRPSGYAVVANERRELAIVRTSEGILLPGGGIDDTESAKAAIVREVAEECAIDVAVHGTLGDAIQFVHSKAKRTNFEKRSRFMAASILAASDGRTPEHETLWMTPAEALTALTYESHQWAIRRWQRLNT